MVYDGGMSGGCKQGYAIQLRIGWRFASRVPCLGMIKI